MPSSQQLAILNIQIAPAAVASENLTGVPPELTCAQCIIESGWMAKASGDFNYFGIKGNPQNGTLCATREWFTSAELLTFLKGMTGRTATLIRADQPRSLYAVKDWFRNYDSLIDAFSAHDNLLATSPYYKPALAQFQQDKDLAALIAAVAKHYATDPNYEKVVSEIALSSYVTQAIEAARKAATA